MLSSRLGHRCCAPFRRERVAQGLTRRADARRGAPEAAEWLDDPGPLPGAEPEGDIAAEQAAGFAEKIVAGLPATRAGGQMSPVG